MYKEMIIPSPKKADFFGEPCVCPDFTNITFDRLLSPAEEAVKYYADKLNISGNTPIEVVYDAGISLEGYELFIGGTIVVSASDIRGAHHGLAALIQMSTNGPIAFGSVKSEPDSSYRTVMIDLARNWHEPNMIFEYIDMCWLLSIKYLHLHFTDDQSYTLPSSLIPKVSTPDRHYTFEEIFKFDEYAASRGVEIIPEIDVPGHTISFQKDYADIFGTDGIIIQTEESMKMMQALFVELCQMFKHSHFIHIGGDEAAIIKWTENPKCRDYAISKGIDFDMEDKKYLSERMLANFVNTMGEAVLSCGRTPVAWEGFAKEVDEFVSKKIIMYSWESFYQVAPELLEAGFKVINGSWNPMYIVAPEPVWPLNELYDWSIYSWKPVHPGSPYAGSKKVIEPNDNVIGGQLLAWGDRIPTSYKTVEEGVLDEQRLVFERAGILSERTWNVEYKKNFEDFKEVNDKIVEILNNVKGKK